MSDNDKPEPELAADEPTAPAPETDATAEPIADEQPNAGAEPPRAGNRLAVLAFFVSIVALLAVLYSIYLDRDVQLDVDEGAESLVALNGRIAGAVDSITALEAALAELKASDRSTAGQLDLLQGEMEERQQALDSLPPRIANMEQSLASLQGISAGARNDWLLAEAEYYMQIANAQLQLAGDPYLAAQALRMADERVAQVSDPAFTDVRRAIADELATLDGMSNVDIEGLSLTLASLARVVQSLPLRETGSATADQSEGIDPDVSGIDRAWASVKKAASGLVRVTGPEETAIPLMTPDAVYFLRTNLTLQLQAARLAVLRGEQAVFEQSLDDASSWLREYFDTDSAQVSSALETIAEVSDSMIVVQRPDISESLRRLRQIQALSEPAQ